MSAALERLGPFEMPAPCEAETGPVFLLATGWRTGSTLLQRVLMTDRRLMLWGEPLGRFGLLTRLSEAVCGMQQGWPPSDYWVEQRPPGDLTTSWIANLFPPADDFRASLRALFDRWLGDPARARGFSRWGIKEVRLGATEATLLRWLYPSAQFVVGSRNPTGAYSSLKGSASDWSLYARWPDRKVDCVVSFARHWDSLASSWGNASPNLAPFIIRYEEVGDGSLFAPLASRLRLSLDPAPALAVRVGETGRPAALSLLERLLLRRETKSGSRVMGYT